MWCPVTFLRPLCPSVSAATWRLRQVWARIHRDSPVRGASRGCGDGRGRAWPRGRGRPPAAKARRPRSGPVGCTRRLRRVRTTHRRAGGKYVVTTIERSCRDGYDERVGPGRSGTFCAHTAVNRCCHQAVSPARASTPGGESCASQPIPPESTDCAQDYRAFPEFTEGGYYRDLLRRTER